MSNIEEQGRKRVHVKDKQRTLTKENLIRQKPASILKRHCMLFRTANSLNQPRCPATDERIKKIWLIYIIMLYLGIKKKKYVIYWKVDGMEIFISSKVS